METHEPTPAPSGTPSPAITESQARNWSMFCHLSTLAGYTAIPFANILAPLILWKIKREAHPMIDHHGKEALNFQISVMLYLIACIPLVFVFIGFFLMALIGLADLVLTIIAALQASNGVAYRYPLTIRLIK